MRCRVSSFRAGHVRRRRIVRRFGDDLARQPRAALHRVRFPAVRQARQDRRLSQHAAQFAPAVPDRNKPEAALGLIGQVVVAGDDFVRDHEIGLDQIPHRQVVPDQVLQKLDRLLPQFGACVACELRETACDPVRAPGTCRDSTIGTRTRRRTGRIADRRSSARLRYPVVCAASPVAASFNVVRSGGPFHRKYDSLEASS